MRSYLCNPGLLSLFLGAQSKGKIQYYQHKGEKWQDRGGKCSSRVPSGARCVGGCQYRVSVSLRTARATWRELVSNTKFLHVFIILSAVHEGLHPSKSCRHMKRIFGRFSRCTVVTTLCTSMVVSVLQYLSCPNFLRISFVKLPV